MNKFGNFSYNESMNKNNSSSTATAINTDEMMANFLDELEACLNKYKSRLEKEFNSLSKNNENWKRERGTDCNAFKQKMWAISAPFESARIIRALYVNRETRNN